MAEAVAAAEPDAVDSWQCSHPLLREVDGLYGYYHCPACGDYFNLSLINLTRHSPRDLLAMAQWITRALTPSPSADADVDADVAAPPPAVREGAPGTNGLRHDTADAPLAAVRP